MADVARWRRDDRGVSTALGYALNVGVAAILVTMLLLSAGTLVEDQRERAVETELQVIGERVAADLAAADRLARASDGGTVEYGVDVPARVTGVAYDVRLDASGGNCPVPGSDCVVLTADRTGVSVAVPYDTETPVAAATLSGGDFTLVYENATDTLEVEDA